MEKKNVSVSGMAFILSLWAFYYCLHNIIVIAVIDAEHGLENTLGLVEPNLAILWAVVSGVILIVGLFIHFYYLKYSDAPASPLLNTRELIAILIAVFVVTALSYWQSYANIVSDNEDVAKTVAIIRDIIEPFLLIGVYAVFNPDRFVKKTEDANAVEVKKQQLKELLDSGVLTKEEYDKEINSL